MFKCTEEMSRCKVCGNHFIEGMIFSGVCNDCCNHACSEFSTALGEKYLCDHYFKNISSEAEFYLEYLNGISNCIDAPYLIELVKKEPPVDYEDKLKSFCTDDLPSWLEFYYGVT